MADYKKMYAVLFNAITDALDALQEQNPVLAAGDIGGSARKTMLLKQRHRWVL